MYVGNVEKIFQWDAKKVILNLKCTRKANDVEFLTTFIFVIGFDISCMYVGNMWKY